MKGLARLIWVAAMAMVTIPPMTASEEWVPECRPTIKPKVVMTPEVKPKFRPVLVAPSIG